MPASIKSNKSKEPSPETTVDESNLNNETEQIAPEDGPEGESEAGKLRQLLSVLKKVVGVKVRNQPCAVLTVLELMSFG